MNVCHVISPAIGRVSSDPGSTTPTSRVGKLLQERNGPVWVIRHGEEKARNAQASVNGDRTDRVGGFCCGLQR